MVDEIERRQVQGDACGQEEPEDEVLYDGHGNWLSA